MTVAASIFDSLIAKVTSTLPGYVELPDRIEVESNPSLIMNKGFLVAYGDETNDPAYVCDILRLDRDFQIVLLQGSDYTESNTEVRKAFEKSLVEDAYLLIKEILRDPDLEGLCLDVSYNGQSGIEYITDLNGTEQFMAITLSVTVKYQEQY